jgi:nitrogen fixation protein FixH
VAQHPLGRAPERKLQFGAQGDGSYVSQEKLPSGRWLLRIEVARGGDHYRTVAEVP